MEFRVGLLAAALLVFAAGGQEVRATEPKTWYVYCEGASADGHWAVFSENFWPHPETAGYARLVGSAAKAFFETRHDISLEGCAGVNFRDDSLAEHSRSLTVQLHRRMGDRIFFLRLPAEILPATAVMPARAPRQDDGSTDQMAAGQRVDTEEWSPSAPPR
jgi:hypothetical protein